MKFKFIDLKTNNSADASSCSTLEKDDPASYCLFEDNKLESIEDYKQFIDNKNELESTDQDISYDDEFYRFNIFTKKLEKIPNKFVRNNSFANVTIARDCEEIEFIDHEIKIIKNENINYGSKKERSTKQKFQILKLKNLSIKSFYPGQCSNENFIEENNNFPTRFIKGKKFIILAFDAIYHGCSEFYGQFELLNNFDNEIKPFFIFANNGHDYHRGVYEIYKKDFDLTDEDIFDNNKENIILEEVYILFDTNNFLSKNIDKRFNIKKIIPYGPASGIATYYRVNEKIVEDCLAIDNNFPFTVPDHETLRFGLMLMAKRHKKYIDSFDKRIDVLYISRENYSKNFYESFQELLKQENVSPQDFYNKCEIFYKRTILDEDQFFNMLEAFAKKRKKTVKKVFFEELSYIEQISLVKNSDIIVSIQGSGLCNAIFADKNAKIIEIAHPFDDSKFRNLYNPISVDTEEKYINYIKIANWYTLLYADWKFESIEIMQNEKIIDN